MTVARPPVVEQSEWDAALAAMTKREQAVATAMHELAAARKRMPMVRVEQLVLCAWRGALRCIHGDTVVVSGAAVYLAT